MDIKSKYSQIHTGGNKWVVKPDRNIYDKLIIDTTKNLFSKLNETERIKSKDLQKKVGNIIDNTEHFVEHIFDDEKDLKKELNIASDTLKCTVLNHSTFEE